MGFDAQEEDQDPGLNPGQANSSYDYPLFNRALLSGFAPSTAVPGEGVAAAQSEASQPIGGRIVDLTAQQTAPSAIPRPEKDPDVAASSVRVVDLQRPLAGLDGLMPSANKAAMPTFAPASTPSLAERRSLDGGTQAQGIPGKPTAPAPLSRPAAASTATQPAGGTDGIVPSQTGPGLAATGNAAKDLSQTASTPVVPQSSAVSGMAGAGTTPPKAPEKAVAAATGANASASGGNFQPGGATQPKQQQGQSGAGSKTGQQGTATPSSGVSDDLHTQARMMVPGGVQTIRTGKKGGKGGQGTSRRVDNIQVYLPAIQRELQAKNMDDPDMMQYVLATISSETGKFQPLTEGQSSHNTEKTPFDKYDHKNGNLGPPDGERYRGRGFIQLTGRDNYRHYGERIHHPELVDHPEMANDPEIAAQLLRAYLEDHQAEIRKQIDLSKTDPLQAEKTFALFMKYNADVNNADPSLKKALASDSLVMARKQVNGPHSTIPNGLEHFLPAYIFAGRNREIATESGKNANMTVGDAARIWTRGDDAGRAGYLATLEKRSGIRQDTKLSDLTPEEREKLQSAQGQYVTGIMTKAEHAVKARAKAAAAARAKAKAQQQNSGGQARQKAPQASGQQPARGNIQPPRPGQPTPPTRNGQSMPAQPQRPTNRPIGNDGPPGGAR